MTPLLYSVRTAPLRRALPGHRGDRRARPPALHGSVRPGRRGAAERLRAPRVPAHGGGRGRDRRPRRRLRARAPVAGSRLSAAWPRPRAPVRRSPPARALRAVGASSAAPSRSRSPSAGRVTLTRAELEANGLPPAYPLDQLGVFTQGRKHEFAVEADAIAFQARALSTAYTGKNVFIVAWQQGVPAMKVPLTLFGPPVPLGYTKTEKNYIYVANAPLDADPWVWDLLFSDGGEWPYEYDRERGRSTCRPSRRRPRRAAAAARARADRTISTRSKPGSTASWWVRLSFAGQELGPHRGRDLGGRPAPDGQQPQPHVHGDGREPAGTSASSTSATWR